MTGPLILIDAGAVLFVVALDLLLSMLLRAVRVAREWEDRARDWEANARFERERALQAECCLKWPVERGL